MYPSLYFILSAAVTFTPFTLAVNSTAPIGTNCKILANHTVVSGDSLTNVAAATNTTLDQIRFVNPQIKNPRLINNGDIIAIPNPQCVAPINPPLAEPTATCSTGKQATITVVMGDTLVIIAKEKLGITLLALLAVNPQIQDLGMIEVGDVLNVPLCGKSATGGGGSNVTMYEMKKGGGRA